MNNFTELARAAKSVVVDADGLASALRRQVRGDVRFDDGSRALYATDGSNYRQVPIGVVLPRDVDDVVATISLAREYGANEIMVLTIAPSYALRRRSYELLAEAFAVVPAPS